jgi:hypothetical protein
MPLASAIVSSHPADDAVRAAKDAISGLFDAGLIDEDSATLAFVAITIDIRRVQHGAKPDDAGQDARDG